MLGAPLFAAAPAEEEARNGHGSHVAAAVVVPRAFWLFLLVRFTNAVRSKNYLVLQSSSSSEIMIVMCLPTP